MRYYAAPMEGITDSIYRRLHSQYFPGIDRYYTPFFSPTIHRALTAREARELPLADTLPVQVIPQLLTKNSEDFIWMADVCKERGYSEVNLNLGCPSGTVTAKGKGAGMLRDPDELDRFLNEIFSASPLPISIKTRIGYQSPDEFPKILDIYSRYPICELTIHPRVRQAFYNGNVEMDVFQHAVSHSKAPLCYNGNLCTTDDIQNFSNQFPGIDAVMIGRGLIGNPGMLSPGGTTSHCLENFLEELFEEYAIHFGGTRNAMFRLKENWRYLFCLFEPNAKLQKRLRKAVDVTEYKAVTAEILNTLPIQKQLSPDW